VLGVLGDPAKTGKPVGGDLREGKLTPLLAAATAAATGTDAVALERVGAPDLDDSEVRALRDLVVELGAVEQVEQEIKRLTDEAVVALRAAPIIVDARDALEELAAFVAWRDA
jgi:geranylgeranyl diphosphate synthase type I